MRKKEISSLGPLETSGRESGRTTEKDGQKGYSSKSRKASSQPRRRRQNAKANAAKKRQSDIHQKAFKLADLLPDKTIKKLRAIKEEIENGRTNLEQ